MVRRRRRCRVANASRVPEARLPVAHLRERSRQRKQRHRAVPAVLARSARSARTPCITSCLWPSAAGCRCSHAAASTARLSSTAAVRARLAAPRPRSRRTASWIWRWTGLTRLCVRGRKERRSRRGHLCGTRRCASLAQALSIAPCHQWLAGARASSFSSFSARGGAQWRVGLCAHGTHRAPVCARAHHRCDRRRRVI